jgi:hypothetical protein
MADKVTGVIGNEQVELNNAATEATLLKLIQAVQASGGSKAASAAANLAGSAGVNANAVNQANSSLSALGIKTTPVTQGFSTLFTQVAGGIPSISGVMAGFTGLTGPLGIAITLFSMLSEFQEKNLETYKNFLGSLPKNIDEYAKIVYEPKAEKIKKIETNTQKSEKQISKITLKK